MYAIVRQGDGKYYVVWDEAGEHLIKCFILMGKS